MEMRFRDIIAYVINYGDLKNALTKWNYQALKHELEFTMRDIREMEPKSYNAFLHFLKTDEYPLGYINGVDVQALVEERGMAPAGAFLAASLMKTDPSLGCFILAPFKDDPVHSDLTWDPEEEAEPDDLKDLMNELRENAKKHQQDTSDFAPKTEDSK